MSNLAVPRDLIGFTVMVKPKLDDEMNALWTLLSPFSRPIHHGISWDEADALSNHVGAIGRSSADEASGARLWQRPIGRKLRLADFKKRASLDYSFAEVAGITRACLSQVGAPLQTAFMSL